MSSKDSRTRLSSCIWTFLLLCLFSQVTEGATKEEVAEVIRAGYAAWDSGDVDAIARMYDPKTFGFGFRSAPWRDRSTLGEEEYRKRIKQFFDQMESWHIEVDELHTSVEGDLGLACGVHIESFKVKGRPPEKARVRFTLVLRKYPDGWRRLLYHRDIQPFDEQGRYLTDHTKVSQEK